MKAYPAVQNPPTPDYTQRPENEIRTSHQEDIWHQHPESIPLESQTEAQVGFCEAIKSMPPDKLAAMGINRVGVGDMAVIVLDEDPTLAASSLTFEQMQQRMQALQAYKEGQEQLRQTVEEANIPAPEELGSDPFDQVIRGVETRTHDLNDEQLHEAGLHRGDDGIIYGANTSLGEGMSDYIPTHKDTEAAKQLTVTDKVHRALDSIKGLLEKPTTSIPHFLYVLTNGGRFGEQAVDGSVSVHEAIDVLNNLGSLEEYEGPIGIAMFNQAGETLSQPVTKPENAYLISVGRMPDGSVDSRYINQLNSLLTEGKVDEARALYEGKRVEYEEFKSQKIPDNMVKFPEAPTRKRAA